MSESCLEASFHANHKVSLAWISMSQYWSQFPSKLYVCCLYHVCGFEIEYIFSPAFGNVSQPRMWSNAYPVKSTQALVIIRWSWILMSSTDVFRRIHCIWLFTCKIMGKQRAKFRVHKGQWKLENKFSKWESKRIGTNQNSGSFSGWHLTKA